MQSTPFHISTLKASARRLDGWILFLILIIAPSCGKLTPVVYSEFVSMPENGIPRDWEYTFSPQPFDTTESVSGIFDLIILVRYSNRCASESVIFDVECFSLQQSQPDSARIEIKLFNHDSSPIGKGNLGVYETADTIARAIHIPEGYVVSVSTPLDPEDTKGILDFGIKLARTGQEEFNLLNAIGLQRPLREEEKIERTNAIN